ncbi:MAG: helix-turn-helix domain-containing protein, partial [Azovibrio sp.]
IEALEQGDWASLPGRTFVKGFVRNYARAVRLDPVPLLAELDKLPGLTNPSLDPPVSIHAPMPDQSEEPRRDMLVVLAGVALVVLAVAAYFFLPASLLNFQDEEPPSILATESVDENMAEEEALLGTDQTQPIQQEVGGVVAPVQIVPVPPVSPSVSVTPAPISTPIPAVTPNATAVRTETLSFRFEKDSWVEIKDGTGNQIVSRQYPAGTVKEVSGVPPFSMIVGNASYAKLQYKGKEVVLEPRNVSDVARLTLE